jgi:hypothetical protein
LRKNLLTSLSELPVIYETPQTFGEGAVGDEALAGVLSVQSFTLLEFAKV